jgi:hypothetical protein
LLALSLVDRAAPASANAVLVPAPFRAAILLRSLGYERGVISGKGPAVVLVLHGADAASQADAREMASTFTALAGRMTLSERKVELRSHQHASATETIKLLSSVKPAAVYFAAGLETLAAQLASQADQAHWVPMCADGSHLRAGCALAVRPLAAASQLVVDLARAKRAGLSFDPRLLRLAFVLQ